MIFWKRVKQAINDLWYPRSVTVGKPVETQELDSLSDGSLQQGSSVLQFYLYPIFRRCPSGKAKQI